MGTMKRRRPPKEAQDHQNRTIANKDSMPKEKAQEQQIDKAIIEKDEEELQLGTTIWQVIRTHPAFWGLIFLGIPYGMFVLVRWIVLQHPPSISMLRPAVDPQTGRRQVLILGTMSSGTTSMAQQLLEILPEVGHEDADTAWKFVRDGTVSWFHGIRYWPSSFNNKEQQRDKMIHQLCWVQWQFSQHNHENYGFGPTLFGTPNYNNNCSVMFMTSECYQQACRLALQREFACATSTSPSTSANDNDDSSCQPAPFAKTLLQTREPWKIVTSLVAKYCWNNGVVLEQPPMTLNMLFHALGLLSKDENGRHRPHCVVQMIDYVTGYYNTVLDHNDVSAAAANDNDNDMIGIYAIENTTACQVAQLAGLDHPSTTVYYPNHVRYQQACSMQKQQQQQSTTTTMVKKSNPINQGRVSVADLLEFTTAESLERIQALYQRLGYDYPMQFHNAEP